MAVETWDQLPKNQTDPELIEEAIARLIAVHEANPEAHTGDNESLQAHRQNEIIDHPASSIVPDKFSPNFASYANYFNVASSYDHAGIIEQAGYGRIYAQVTSATHDSYITPQVEILDGAEFPTMGFVWDLTFSIGKGGTPNYTGLLSCGDDYVGFGFSVNNTGVRAFYAIDGSITYSSYLTMSFGQLHRARFFVDSVAGTMQVILDGDVVATMTITGGASAMTYYIYVLTHWISGSAGNSFTIALYSTMLYLG